MGDAIGKAGDGFISEGVPLFISSWPVIHSPNLSACHRCRLGFPINGSVDRLKTMDSKWRIVLLCRECFTGVRSAQVCSYCFSWFPELEKGLLDCNMCSRRVHRTCVSLHHRNFTNSLLDEGNFNCVDCCPIPQLKRGDPKSSGGSTSRIAFRVSSDDVVRGATPISEKKTASKGKARENEAKKVMVAISSSELERKTFGAIDFVKEPSRMNLTTPDEKMALCLHQTINGSRRISRSLCPKGVSQFTIPGKEQCSYNSAVRSIDSNSCTYHETVEVSGESKSLQDDRGDSESVLTNGPLFNQENGDLMNQVRGCSTGNPEDLSLNGMEGSRKVLDFIDDGCNAVLALFPPLTFNTWLRSTTPFTKYGFSDCDGEGYSKLKRKSIDAICLNGSLKRYCRRNGGSVRILQEKGSSLKFTDSIDDGSTANSALVPFTSLNTWLRSTTPVAKHIFGDLDKGEYSKFFDDIGLGWFIKKYFRKYWDSGRITEGNPHPISTNSPLFKRNIRVLMKQTMGCYTGCSGDFSLKECSLNFFDSTDDVCHAGLALLPYHSFNLWSNSSVVITKSRFGDVDGEESSGLRRKSIDAMAYRSMKKYFRKHRSCKLIMKENSKLMLDNNSLFNENEDLMKQVGGCIIGYPEAFSSKEKVSSQFLDSTNDGDNVGSAIPPRNYSFCDGDRKRLKELKRKPIDAMVSDNMKKYYRKRWSGSKRFVLGNAQLISANSSLFRQENGDPLKQTSGCQTSCHGDFFLEDISLKSPSSTDEGSDIDFAPLQFHGLNSSLPTISYRFGDGDGEGYFKLQRRSIDAIGSDGSLKKYFRKHSDFCKLMRGNNS